jgi:hypothetical protein
MRWRPSAGHVPRGFLGASGSLAEVELVLVLAEPGDPHPQERHEGLQTPYSYAAVCLATGKDLFHRNVRKILGMCWPDLAFEQQMRKVWLTDSVLCSARTEGGNVSPSASRACGQRYLLAQLQLFPGALVVALGRKAQQRLTVLGFTRFLPAFAAAPPGCNGPKAQASWARIPIELNERRRTRA